MNEIIAERMHRQGFILQATTQTQYEQLFRKLQPVTPQYFSYPGSPPQLLHRTTIDDYHYSDKMRAERKIVKAQFWKGQVGYVFADELEIFANAYYKPINNFSIIQEAVFEAIQYTGPLTPRQIQEEVYLNLGYKVLNKQILPALKRLQRAFLIFEDQVDTDWERGWYNFASEWPDIEINLDKWERSAKEIILRFIKCFYWANYEHIRDWTCFSNKNLQKCLQDLEKENKIEQVILKNGKQGWVIQEELKIHANKIDTYHKRKMVHKKNCKSGKQKNINGTVFMLHKSDMIVKASQTELKLKFNGLKVLQYLLIDGELKGAVCGHWRIGPYDVDDVILLLPESERKKRKDEITKAIKVIYREPEHRILKYDGKRF